MSKSRVIAVAFAGLLTVGPAIAADLSYQATPPPVPAINWTGFYVGAHAGPGWSLSEQTFTGSNLTNENNYTGTAFSAAPKRASITRQVHGSGVLRRSSVGLTSVEKTTALPQAPSRCSIVIPRPTGSALPPRELVSPPTKRWFS